MIKGGENIHMLISGRTISPISLQASSSIVPILRSSSSREPSLVKRPSIQPSSPWPRVSPIIGKRDS